MLFTAPFNALAETCETDNPLLNMPILLFVALVGATVGGKVTTYSLVTIGFFSCHCSENIVWGSYYELWYLFKQGTAILIGTVLIYNTSSQAV